AALDRVPPPRMLTPGPNPFPPSHPNPQRPRPPCLFCLAHLPRRTNQRTLDIDDDLRTKVLDVLRHQHAPAHLLTLVSEGGTLESAEQKQFFGEALPLGLKLSASGE